MWQVWTSSWCTHHTRAVTRSSSQGSKADYNKSRQLKNSQQQLWAWTCQRFARWGSLVSPRNVVASGLGALQNLPWALGSAGDPQSVQWHDRTKQSFFLTKCNFTCQRKEEMAQVSRKHCTPLISTPGPLTTFKPWLTLSLFYSNSQKNQAALLTDKALLDPLAVKFPTSNVSLRAGQKGLNSPKFYLPKQGSLFHLCKGKQRHRDTAQSTQKAKQLWLSGLGCRFSFPVALYASIASLQTISRTRSDYSSSAMGKAMLSHFKIRGGLRGLPSLLQHHGTSLLIVFRSPLFPFTWVH